MSSFLSDRKRGTETGSPFVNEVGICGGTSSMAAVRARQMARQREINAASARKMRSEEYLKNLYEEEQRERQDEKDRLRARVNELEEERMERLATRADRLRLRTDPEQTYPSLADKKCNEAAGLNSETPYSVLKARRRREQYKRQSNELREQVSSDLARARALLREERKKEDIELTRDISRSYETARQLNRTGLYQEPMNHRRELPSSILKKTTQRRLDIGEDWHSPTRRKTGTTNDRFSDRFSNYESANGTYRADPSTSNSSLRSSASRSRTGTSRLPKEVHWSMDD